MLAAITYVSKGLYIRKFRGKRVPKYRFYVMKFITSCNALIPKSLSVAAFGPLHGITNVMTSCFSKS